MLIRAVSRLPEGLKALMDIEIEDWARRAYPSGVSIDRLPRRSCQAANPAPQRSGHRQSQANSVVLSPPASACMVSFSGAISGNVPISRGSFCPKSHCRHFRLTIEASR